MSTFTHKPQDPNHLEIVSLRSVERTVLIFTNVGGCVRAELLRHNPELDIRVAALEPVGSGGPDDAGTNYHHAHFILLPRGYEARVKLNLYTVQILNKQG